MRIVVVGAGAIGGLYGGVLAKAGHQVGLLVRGEHLRAIRSRGLRVESPTFGSFVANSEASDNPAELGQADLVLFTVKTYDLEQAAQAAKLVLAEDGSLVTFQNGLEAPDRVAAVVGEQRVLIGTTGVEATIREPGVIAHIGNWHFVTVSALNGPPTPRVQQIVQTMQDAGINASAAADGRRALWEKAWMLIPMATITAVCRAPIGPIREVPESRRMLQVLLEEVGAVARACGYDLPEAAERVRGIVENAPPTMKASMARDFERGGRTELEALTGAFVRLADAHGVEVPVSRTAYAILKVRQQVEAQASEKPLGIGAGGR